MFRANVLPVSPAIMVLVGTSVRIILWEYGAYYLLRRVRCAWH